mmetsp:Transcript_17967/g.39671  ORF Transcript_17967/g.39671 Transcript_17967/m.39671 type:complete len:194 (+) Transcript_17967:89-670(+)
MLAGTPPGPIVHDLQEIAQPRDEASEKSDFVFWCRYCVQLIQPNSPIYMRNDACFCSSACREQGISPQYLHFEDSARKVFQCMERNQTEASLGGDSGEQEMGGFRVLESGVVGLSRKLLGFAVQQVATRVWGGNKLIRTYSSSVEFGQELAKDTSFAFLFSLLPEIDQLSDHSHQESMSTISGVSGSSLVCAS